MPPISFLSKSLRVFFILDTSKLSDEFKDHIGYTEGSYEVVDADRPRDFEWTEEIVAAQIGAVLVDDSGDEVARFMGREGYRKAERARNTARITYDIEVEADEDDGSVVPDGFNEADLVEA